MAGGRCCSPGLRSSCVGSVVCALAQTIGLLIAARVVQAVGGAAGLVLTRAIVRDLFDREFDGARARLSDDGDGHRADAVAVRSAAS